MLKPLKERRKRRRMQSRRRRRKLKNANAFDNNKIAILNY
jgi:hypothetical protein